MMHTCGCPIGADVIYERETKIPDRGSVRALIVETEPADQLSTRRNLRSCTPMSQIALREITKTICIHGGVLTALALLPWHLGPVC